MVHSILDLTNIARASSVIGDHATVHEAISTVESRLKQLSIAKSELHGRKPVDALLNLALAGCGTRWLYDELSHHADDEVKKWGRRKSCSSMTLAQLAERAAAAGCLSPLPLFDTIGTILVERGEPTYETTATALASGEYSLGASDAAARWVYRASSRCDKEASASADGFQMASDWGDSAGGSIDGSFAGFEDSSRPLTIDLGCGFGVGPLVYSHSLDEWQGDNLLGCDLSASGIGYARGLASRWGVSGRCKFVRDDARAVLRAARRSTVGVRRILLSCPTPYAQVVPTDTSTDVGEAVSSGNAQLPSSHVDTSFLGHAEIFDEMARSMVPGEGQLYLSSNVEDVALTLKRNAEAAGFEAELIEEEEGSHACDAKAKEIATPRRQQLWRAAGGERAEGPEWDAARPMPWASETERAHQCDGRPIHRVVMRLRGGGGIGGGGLMLWIPPMRFCPPGSRPSTDDIDAFAKSVSDAPRCKYPGSVDDIPHYWFVNQKEECIGKGRDAFERASNALEDLECMELRWLMHRTEGDTLAVCSRQFFFVWLMYANKLLDKQFTAPRQRSISWGTTRRHVLCGEERLTVRWDDVSDEVLFEVKSFSRPRHLFSWAAYPYVILQQKRFARDATAAMTRLASLRGGYSGAAPSCNAVTRRANTRMILEETRQMMDWLTTTPEAELIAYREALPEAVRYIIPPPSPLNKLFGVANLALYSLAAFTFMPTLINGDSPFVATADAKLEALFGDGGYLLPGGGVLHSNEAPPSEQHLIDLGSGDGAVVRAATRLGGYGVASGYEINPGLHRIAKLKSAGRGETERFHLESLWDAKVDDADVVVVYCLPKFLKDLGAKLSKELRHGATVVSNAYPFPLEELPHLKLVKEAPVETAFLSQDKSSSLWFYRVERGVA